MMLNEQLWQGAVMNYSTPTRHSRSANEKKGFLYFKQPANRQRTSRGNARVISRFPMLSSNCFLSTSFVYALGSHISTNEMLQRTLLRNDYSFDARAA